MRFSYLIRMLLIFGFYFPVSSHAEFLKGMEVQGGMELPFQIGARGKVYLPANFFITAGLGYAPSFFLDVYGDLSGSLGIMGENTGKAVAKSIGDSIVIDIRGGYSFDPDEGFYIEGGYLMMTGGGGSVDHDVIEGAIDFDYSGFSEGDSVELAATTHNLTVHIGYMLLLSERLSLLFDVGLIKPLIASVEATPQGTSSFVSDTIKQDVEPYIEDKLKTEAIIPTATVWLSYLF